MVYVCTSNNHRLWHVLSRDKFKLKFKLIKAGKGTALGASDYFHYIDGKVLILLT